MEKPKIFLDIHRLYASMNPAMRSVSDYILQNFEKVAYLGSAELAQESGVSIATISRYVKIMGFTNYKAFELSMVSALGSYASETENETDKLYERLEYGGISKKDSIEIVCKKVFKSNVQMLEDSLAIVDVNRIEKVSQLIVDARNVIFYGVGRSWVTAESGRSRLYRLGINAFCYRDSHEQIVSACMCDERDVIIAVSNYGRSKSVVENVIRAKKSGAITVGITSAKNSPLAREVDYPLYTSFNHENLQAIEENLSYESASENIAQVALLDCIYVSVSFKKDVNHIEKFCSTALELESEKVKK